MKPDLELSTFQKRPAYRYIRATDNLPGLDVQEAIPMARIKLFDPTGSWTWYLAAYDAESRTAFGLADGFQNRQDLVRRRRDLSGKYGHIGRTPLHADGYIWHTAFGLADGWEREYGYISMGELVEFRGRFGLPVERDLHWAARPLRELA